MYKILYVGKFIPNEGAAGIHVYNIAKCLEEQGVEIVYVAYSKKSFKKNRIYDIRKPMGVIGSLKNVYDIITGCYEFDVFKNAIEKEHPNAVILYNTSNAITKKAINYCRQKNIRIIVENTEWYTVTSITSGLAGHLLTKSVDKRIRKTDNTADGVIVISKYLENHYKKQNVPTFNLPPLFSLENESVERIQFRPIKFVYAGSPGGKDILKPFVDSIIEHNKHNDCNVEFHIYGINQEQLSHITGYQINAEDGVFAHGRVSHDEVIRAVSNSHFTVLLRHNMRYAKAGYSTKVAESLALGTPVICNNIGGTDVDINDSETGFKINDCDIKTLKNVINTVIEMGEMDYFNMRRACINYAQKRYAAQNYSETLLNFILGK